jgi:hypothetical protein
LQVLTKPELQDWFKPLAAMGDERLNHDENGPFFTHSEANCIHLEYPSKLERLPFFARYLATVGYEDRDFQGALVWLREWSVWNGLDEGIGYRIIEALNRASGQPMSFEVGTGHLFRADELVDAIGMLLQPMIFGWEAFYRPTWAYGCDEFFLHVSHDSYVTLVTRTAAFYERVSADLQAVKLTTLKASDHQRARFCRRA